MEDKEDDPPSLMMEGPDRGEGERLYATGGLLLLEINDN